MTSPATGRQVAEQEARVAELRAAARPLERPGLRRGAGARAAALRDARRDVVRRARGRRRALAGRRGRAGSRRQPPAAPGSPTCGAVSRSAGGTQKPTQVTDQRDLDAVAAQLGRDARGVRRVAHRCPCGNPDVVETAPRLPDGTPFPTALLPHLPARRRGDRHPRGRGHDARDDRPAGGRRRPAGGLPGRARALPRGARTRSRRCPRSQGVSAGGMPDRVKCLHVLVAHSLAEGPGVNPLGDEALAALPDWWRSGPCVASTGAERRDAGRRDRLRHQLDPAARRRHRRRRGHADATSTGGWRSSGSARTSTAPAGFAPDALARTFAACDRYADVVRAHRRRAGPVRRDLGVARRRRTATSSWPASATRSASSPRS